MFAEEDKTERRFQASIHGYEIHDQGGPQARRGPARTALKAFHDAAAKRIRKGR